MDMIGRMEKDMPLTIEGIGGSLIWEQTLKEIECNAFPLTLKREKMDLPTMQHSIMLGFQHYIFGRESMMIIICLVTI